jgi:demethylmenaquinone methyltransferase/2-methoxy-6-polyprenyl-1,4-benzoquinol methylase
MQRPAPDANAAAFAPARDDVFSRIAGRYDLLCDLFSFGIHRLWKRRMARVIARHRGDIVLDLASGTGDIPVRLLGRGGAPRELWVTDISEDMLAIARPKLEGLNAGIRFALLDAENLHQIADASIDVCSMSFGMKICDRQKVMREVARVLRPGGRFYCLEAARITVPGLHMLYLAYMSWCMPLIGRIATGGDRSAYLYLLRGVREFPAQKTLAAEFTAAGYTAVSWRNMTLGIVALHEAQKPGSAAS